MTGRRLGPDGFPLAFPLNKKAWAWLALNHEVALEDDAEVHELVPVLADLEPPPSPEEEEMLF